MKKRLIVFIIVLASLSTIICSNKDKDVRYQYLFTGENDDWKGEYRVESTNKFYEKEGKLGCDSTTSSKFILTYKDSILNLSSIRKIIITYEIGSGKGEIINYYDDFPPETGTFILKTSSNGTANYNQKDIVQIKINIDGKTQTLELKMN